VRYNERFKEKMVAKMTGPSRMSANALSKECGVDQSTLSKWLRDAKVPAMAKKQPTGSKRWTAEEKLRVVLAAAAAGEGGLGEVLRREGLHESDLERFRAEALEGLREKPGRGQVTADAKRVKELEKELRRKEKALAETAAILVLRKKLSAFFSAEEEGDTNEGNDK
jgi:transposase-like protein